MVHGLSATRFTLRLTSVANSEDNSDVDAGCLSEQVRVTVCGI